MIIKYLRETVKISKPFLFIISCVLSFVLGSVLVGVFMNNSIVEQREKFLQVQMATTTQAIQYMERIKDRSKTVKVKLPDGTVREEIFNDIVTNEEGTSLFDMTTYSQSLKVNSTIYGKKKHSFTLLYTPDIFRLPPKYMRVIGGVYAYSLTDSLTIGFHSTYDFEQNKPYIGLNIGYRW